MRAGVVVIAEPGVEDLAVHAEKSGLHSFWVNDTPIVHGDAFVALSLCAKATSRIRLGIGVTSPALRSAPAAASGFASLNALAPGRIICGIGTGNTARRTLGMRPTTAATMETFTAALQGLCAGRAVEYREGDQVRDVRFLHAGGQVNTADPIEFVVAALGPRAAAVAGRRGTGLISFGLLDPTAWRALHDARRDAARGPSHDPRTDSYVVTALHILGEDEAPHSDAAGTRSDTSSCRCSPSPPTPPTTHPPSPTSSAPLNARRCGDCWSDAAPPPAHPTGTPSSTPAISDASHPRTVT